MLASLRPGVRLRVPFGSRDVTGILVEQVEHSDMQTGDLRAASALLDEQPLYSPGQLALLQWAADYYQHPLGEVLLAGLPKALRQGHPLPEDHWRLSRRGLGLPPAALSRAPRQAQAIALLRERASLAPEQLRDAGVSAAVLRQLARERLIERCRPAGGTPLATVRQDGPALTDEQSAILDDLAGRGRFHCQLVEGVTGSGKTEVYLRLIEDCLNRGQQALLLVPEIGLTPQTLRRFEARFGCPIAVLHSGLTDPQRLRAWLAAAEGSAGVVIGTRSAVFTPLARPGLLIVDEEHDSSYKQQDGFRYCARDMMVKRGQLEDCPVILGSATPSLESLHNARRGRYGHSQLTRRAGGGELPPLEILDLRGKALRAGISDTLFEALRTCTAVRGEQALVFLNRRGFAPTLLCHDCGWVAGCRDCDARLTVHLRRKQLRCHHCGARSTLPPSCPHCDGRLLTRGLGTEQTEETLSEALDCPVLRVDSDSIGGRDQLERLLTTVERGEPCVLVGTQMLTKGHHFPGVQLVAVVDADAMLYSSDFRGEERLAQLLVQVAGRAGRERSGGRVLLQTHHPRHPLLEALASGDYRGVAAELLEARVRRGLPPAGQLSLLRCDSRREEEGERFLTRLRSSVESRLPAGCQLVGPLPSALPRRAGRYRCQLWCLSPNRRVAATANAELVTAAEALPRRRDLNWFIDVDPRDVL